MVCLEYSKRTKNERASNWKSERFKERAIRKAEEWRSKRIKKKKTCERANNDQPKSKFTKKNQIKKHFANFRQGNRKKSSPETQKQNGEYWNMFVIKKKSQIANFRYAKWSSHIHNEQVTETKCSNSQARDHHGACARKTKSQTKVMQKRTKISVRS